jgi:hypothetical protein
MILRRNLPGIIGLWATALAAAAADMPLVWPLVILALGTILAAACIIDDYQNSD